MLLCLRRENDMVILPLNHPFHPPSCVSISQIKPMDDRLMTVPTAATAVVFDQVNLFIL